MERDQYEFTCGEIQGDLVTGLNAMGKEGWFFCAIVQQKLTSNVVLLQRRVARIEVAREMPRTLGVPT